MATGRTTKKTASSGSYKSLRAREVAARDLAARRTIVLVPAASSCSAFNYYANNDDEREAASARFRADVSRPTRKAKRR